MLLHNISKTRTEAVAHSTNHKARSFSGFSDPISIEISVPGSRAV